jgi:hypothetical protein
VAAIVVPCSDAGETQCRSRVGARGGREHVGKPGHDRSRPHPDRHLPPGHRDLHTPGRPAGQRAASLAGRISAPRELHRPRLRSMTREFGRGTGRQHLGAGQPEADDQGKHADQLDGRLAVARAQG